MTTWQAEDMFTVFKAQGLETFFFFKWGEYFLKNLYILMWQDLAQCQGFSLASV